MKKLMCPFKAAAFLLSLLTSTYKAEAQVPEDPCDLPTHVGLSVTHISCDTYSFSLSLTAGYAVNYSQWTLDGAVMTGSLTQATQFIPGTGQHTICATVMGGVSSQPGNLCCAKVCTVISVSEELDITTCTVTLDSCSALTDPGQAFLQAFDCDDCKTTVMNATLFGSWKTIAYNPSHSETRTLSREYTDLVNCKKCIVTYNIVALNILDDSFTTDIYFSPGKSCDTLYTNDLPLCLRGRPLKLFFFDHAEAAHDVDPEAGIVVCCENSYGWPNPAFYLYSEELPCCFFNIWLHCSGETSRIQRPAVQAGSAAPLTSVQNALLRLVPNPTSSVFHIESDKGFTNYEKVEILDVNGKTVLVKSDINSTTVIDAARLSKGSYTVKVQARSGIAALKLILMD